jgi:hypothetical protein
MTHDFRSIALVAPDERSEFSAAPALERSVGQGIGPLLRKEDFRAFPRSVYAIAQNSVRMRFFSCVMGRTFALNSATFTDRLSV